MSAGTEPRIDPEPRCACTGGRWCAACLDPAVRRARGLHDPIPIPAFVLDEHGPRVSGFDLERQAAPAAPDFHGVRVVRELITPEDEARLLADLERDDWRPAQSGKHKQHHGARFNFKKRRARLDDFDGLPAFAHEIERALRERLAGDPDQELARALRAYRTADLFALRYWPERRSNLHFHIDDTHAYGEGIVNLSLESEAVLTFLEAGVPEDRARCVRVPLPVRSAVFLYGPARFAWEHAILDADLRARRTSLTLRCLGEAWRETEQGHEILARAARVRPPGGR